jgi:hypothetical protein
MTADRPGEGGGLHGFLEAIYGAVFRGIATVGLPPSFIVILETRGRDSGAVHSVVLITGSYGGERFLVSVTGENADWLRNVRANGGRAAIRHGQRRRVTLVEVPVEERAPILKAYLKWSLGARAIIPVSHSAPIEEFAPIAGDYPVLKITPRAN